MKKEDSIYCCNESIYSEYITKGNKYAVLSSKEEEVKIINDNDYPVWFPKHNFSYTKPPSITSISIDDEIDDSKNDCIEVTVSFDDNTRIYVVFMTLLKLKSLLNEHTYYFDASKIIFVEDLNEEKIIKAIHQLDKQNSLLEISFKY